MSDKEYDAPYIKIFNFKLTPVIGVGKSLFIWFLVISLVPLISVSYLNYINAFKGLTIVAEKSLVNSSALRENNVSAYFDEIGKTLELQSSLESNKVFLQDLQNSFVKEKTDLASFVNSDRTKKLCLSHSKIFNHIKAVNNYYSIYLIDNAGNVLFSLQDDEYIGTNIFFGECFNSKFCTTGREIFETGKTLFSDFERSKVDENLISGMLGKAIIGENGEKIGMMAIRITDEEINKMMSKDEELGETGVSYIIGEDLALRSTSRFTGREDILVKKISNKKVYEWLNTYSYIPSEVKRFEQSDKEIISTYLGVHEDWVYGIARNIDKLDEFGAHWAIIEEIEHNEAFAYTKQLSKTVIISLLITFLLVIIIAVFVTSRTVRPIKELSAWAKQVAEGELVEKDIWAPKNEVGEMKYTFNQLVGYIRSVAYITENIAKGDFDNKAVMRSKNDVLSGSVNEMIDSFRSVVVQANTIAEGDYSASIEPRSNYDELGKALANMTKKLRDSSKEIREQDWLKTGVSQLNARMTGIKDLKELSTEIIDFLSGYFSSRIGLIYVNDNKKLLLTGSYALKDKEHKFDEFELGQGLPGQVAKDGEMIHLTNIGDSTPLIDNTISTQKPKAILIAPFIYEGNVIGVVQLGASEPYNELQQRLFSMCMENIAIAVNAAIAHGKLQNLFHMSQQQQMKLETQQKELRSSNTELQKAGEVIKEKARDLERASAYKSEFLANMSHELRTPLNSILVLSQLLQKNEKGNLTDKQVEFARTVNTSGNDLLNLINEILDLSKVEAGKLDVNIEKVNLRDMADFLRKTFLPIAEEKNLELKIDIQEQVPEFIISDTQRLMQIVKNLMSNALKFTGKGHVELNIYLPDKKLAFSNGSLKSDGVVAISVVDTGIGIPEEKRDLIFEAFKQANGTTSREYGGTGLGLSISKSFASLLQGEIHVKSEENKGTTFTLYVPLQVEGEQGEASHESEKITEVVKENVVKQKKEVVEKENPAAKRKSADAELVDDDRDTIKKDDKVILIVEEDLEFVSVLHSMAGEMGFKVLIAQDGESAIHYADYYLPSAIILDVALPKMDGWEVMKHLKNNLKTRNIPVHFISVSDNSNRAMKMGAIGFLQKPVGVDRLEKVFMKINDIVGRTEKKVLVIDDVAVIRKGIEGMINKKGIITKSVATGKEAFEIIKEEIFDCIILDLGLVDMSGYDLLEMIRKEETIQQVPIIVYTGQEMSAKEEKALKKFAESVVFKGSDSMERILKEVTFFLKQDEKNIVKESAEKPHLQSDDKKEILKNKTILVVDDDMRNVFVLTNLLELKEMKVEVARNGKEALKKLDELKRVDIVLMDLMMPEMDGYEAMRRIRKQRAFRNLPIFALTAKVMEIDREKSIAAGANEFISKPIDNDKLISMLKVWLYNM